MLRIGSSVVAVAVPRDIQNVERAAGWKGSCHGRACSGKAEEVAVAMEWVDWDISTTKVAG